MAGINLASKFAKEIDERFHKESQAAMALNNNYEFTGVETVNVYSIPTVPMTNYKRTGANRYGEPNDLTRNVQSMTVKQDKSFTFIIDKGDKLQSQMVMDAGKALARQLREVAVPMYDTYIFNTLAAEATARGAYGSASINKSNAYAMFLDGQEYMGNRNVPDKGRICFCTYKFANFLKQDPSFMMYGDKAHDQIAKGVIGEIDGCKIVKVPSGRLPAGAAFLLVHPIAATAPKQLDEYKIHDNPPGVSGWLVEGRMLFDCFVLNEKADAIYYHGSQPVLKVLTVQTAGVNAGMTTILVNPDLLTGGAVARYYMTAATRDALTAVAPETAITTADWTELTNSGMEITPEATHKFIRVIEVDANDMPVSMGDAVLNIG